jgi:hypothetical protein
MRKSSTTYSLVLASFMIASTAPGRADIVSNYTFPDGGAGFALNTNSSILTAVRIGLYPPNPIFPPSPVMSLFDPTTPLLTQSEPCLCLLEMSLLGQVLPAIQFPPTPIFNPDTHSNDTSFSFLAGDHSFLVQISLSGSGPVSSWSTFNPTSSPPVFFAGQVGSNDLQNHELLFRILEDNTPMQFSPASAVPETSIWAMLLLGFARVGLMAYRRRGRAVLAA